jgi:hypothetical protein
MTDWLHPGIPAGSHRKIISSLVKGKNKRSREIARNIRSVLEEKKPEVTVVMTGLYDILNPIQGQNPGASIEKIVNECTAFGTVPVLCGLPRIWDKDMDERAALLNESLLRHARMSSIPYIDTRALFMDDESRSYYSAAAVLGSEGRGRLSEVFRQVYRKIQIYIIQ